jgi:hypothetical protein
MSDLTPIFLKKKKRRVAGDARSQDACAVSYLRNIAPLYFVHLPYTQPICVNAARCGGPTGDTPTEFLSLGPILGFARLYRRAFFLWKDISGRFDPGPEKSLRPSLKLRDFLL